MHHDAASNLPGTVEKIIKPIQGEAEKVQIAILRWRRSESENSYR